MITARDIKGVIEATCLAHAIDRIEVSQLWNCCAFALRQFERITRCRKARGFGRAGVCWAAVQFTHTPNGHVLIIGDSMSPPSQQRLASQLPGATVIEAVDLRDLVSFATRLDLASADAVRVVAEFASSLMTATSADELIARLTTINAGRSRKEISPLEQAALDFAAAPSFSRRCGTACRVQQAGRRSRSSTGCSARLHPRTQ